MKNLIYPSIFSAALYMSRMIDENPNLVVKFKLQEAQKKVSRGLILSELITNDERTKPQSDFGWGATTAEPYYQQPKIECELEEPLVQP